MNDANQAEPNYFSRLYKSNPPWDIGHPQKAFQRLSEELKVNGRMLDVGCGTGENALMFAKLGFDVVGIDYVKYAINDAIDKAKKQGINAEFYVMNALELTNLEQKFDIVIDSGLFHTFSNSERILFRTSLSNVLSIKGTYYMLCFSNIEPPGFGPRRIRKEEIYETFTDNWNVISIKPEIFESTFGDAHSWLAKIQYLGKS
ncbi:MAG: class I SAM-dependent methyltransferase [Candidatus Lokiarchaeota archaeon]|nr:class I SAM-dependent methyltransferase [Candidatus Lokiarchaeota archaeon]